MGDKIKNFNDLVSFFKNDMAIKDTLLKVSPDVEDYFNEDSRIEYSDRLSAEIKLVKYYFSKIFETFDFDANHKNIVENKINKIEEKISFGIYGNEDLKKVYQNHISGMKPDFVKEVSDNCKGYFNLRDSKLNELMEKSTTINELLHVVHSYVVNNDRILQSLPVAKQKYSDRNKYTIYGLTSNDIADQIFDNIDVEKTRMGTTDIIALPDRVLMMIRDVGHATTLEIKKDNVTNQFGVTYFIPKICNAEKVNKLPGVTEVNESDPRLSTNGIFQIETDDVGKCIVDFIEKIPNDFDIPEIEHDGLDNEDEKIKTALPKTQPKNVWIDRFRKWRDRIKEIPNKAKKLIENLMSHNNDKER